MTISIVLADDHPVVRQGLRGFLDAEEDFAVVAETADGLETVRAVARLRPDVLILDLMMPGLSGLDVLSVVRQRSERTQVLVFSMCSSMDFVKEAFKGGALGYVLKGCDPHQVVKGVRETAAGRQFIGPALTKQGAQAPEPVAEEKAPDPHDLLTPREREVLQLAAEGLSNVATAARLSISQRTVEMHRAKGMRKLGLKNQVELVRYALRRGMIPLQ